MRVVVPYTFELPDVRAALPDAEWRYVGGSDDAYWELLSELWRAGEGFTIVEHDIVPSTETLDELTTCGADWCACQYPFEATMLYGLGATKFSADLTRRLPDTMDEVARGVNDWHPARHWCSLDAWLQQALRGRRIQMHAHGRVEHLRPGRSHGCR